MSDGNGNCCSLFDTVKATTPSKSVPITRMLNPRGDTYLRLREMHRTSPAKYKEAKKTVPAITPSGITEGRRFNVETFLPSGYGMLDLDGKDNGSPSDTGRNANGVSPWALECRRELTQRGFTAFASPSGNGVKALYRIDWEATEGISMDIHYKICYRAATRLAKGFEVDPSSCNILHLQFLSFDPDVAADFNMEPVLVVPEPGDAERVRIDARWSVDWAAVPKLGIMEQQAVDDAVIKLRRGKPKYRKLWDTGDLTDYDGDTSRGIYALASHLIHDLKPHEILYALTQSALVRDSPKYSCPEGLGNLRRSIDRLLADRAARDIEKFETRGTLLFYGFEPDEVALRNVIVRKFGDGIRYSAQTNTWMFLESGRWHRCDDSGCGRVLDRISTVLASQPDLDPEHRPWVVASVHLKSALEKATNVEALRVDEQALDSRNLLYVGEGRTVDLDTLETRMSLPEDLNTLSTAVGWVPGARQRPRYRKVMDGYFGPNEQEEARFLMRWLGSALYPANLSRTLMFWLGAEGSNGKSSLAKAIAATLGLQQGYAGIAANGLLSKAHFQRSGSEHSAHLSSIPSGCRFLYVDEMGELSWDQELVKKLASVEPMYIRGAYAHHHRLAIPRFNLVVSSNHMPPLENCEPAMLARLVILKFDKTFQKNPEVDALMQSPEFLEGLLDDMLEGLRDYHAGGGSLEPPASCILAGAELVEDIDRIGRFLEECTTTGFVDLEVPTRNQVYLAYKQWCWDMSADRAPESSTRFYADLKRKGYQPDYRGGTNRYIKLRDRELRLLPRDESRSC